MPAEPPTKEEDESPVIALDADDIALLKTYGLGPYTASIKVRCSFFSWARHSIGGALFPSRTALTGTRLRGAAASDVAPGPTG